MLSINGRNARLCDGASRREFMRVGGLSLFGGMSLPRVLPAAGRSDGNGPAKSIIMFNLLGGPAHMDMFDMKPTAPAEVRGEFKPISTSLPGLQICEHMPVLSKWMHRATLIRTYSHTFNSHDPLSFMTGFTDNQFSAQALPTDPPDIGAICQYLKRGPGDLPGAVCMPCFPGSGQKGWRRRGPYGGLLGRQYDPLFTRCKPTFEREPKTKHYDPVLPMGEPFPPAPDALPGMTVDRLGNRRSLLQQLDQRFDQVRSSSVIEAMDKTRQMAYSLLTSSRTRDAFDLSHETKATRQRYGRSAEPSDILGVSWA